MLREALAYYDRYGAQAVLPTKGKVPLVPWKPFQDRRQTREELEKLFSKDNLAKLGATGMGIVLGGESGLVRLDCDDEASFERLKPLLPDGALLFKTPRGYGVILRHTGKEPVKIVPEGTIKELPKFGVKGWGGFTVVPPTEGYRWLSDQRRPIAELDVNGWLERHFGRTGHGKRLAEIVGKTGLEDAEVIALIQDTREGSRNNTIVRLAGYLRWRLVPVEIAKALLKPVVDGWPGEPIGDAEFESAVGSAYKYKEFMEPSKGGNYDTVRKRKSGRAGRNLLPPVGG